MTNTEDNTKMYWVIAIAAIVLAIYLYNKSDRVSDMEYTADDTRMVEETQIQDTSDLDKTGTEMDETNIDKEVDAELDLLIEDSRDL